MEFGCLWRLIPCSTPSTRSCRRCKPWFAQDTWLQLVWLQENWMKDKLNWDSNVMLRSLEHRSHWVAGKLTWDHKVATMAANTSLPLTTEPARQGSSHAMTWQWGVKTMRFAQWFAQQVFLSFSKRQCLLGVWAFLVQKSSKISNLPGA